MLIIVRAERGLRVFVRRDIKRIAKSVLYFPTNTRQLDWFRAVFLLEFLQYSIFLATQPLRFCVHFLPHSSHSFCPVWLSMCSMCLMLCFLCDKNVTASLLVLLFILICSSIQTSEALGPQRKH